MQLSLSLVKILDIGILFNMILQYFGKIKIPCVILNFEVYNFLTYYFITELINLLIY